MSRCPEDRPVYVETSEFTIIIKKKWNFPTGNNFLYEYYKSYKCRDCKVSFWVIFAYIKIKEVTKKS